MNDSSEEAWPGREGQVGTREDTLRRSRQGAVMVWTTQAVRAAAVSQPPSVRTCLLLTARGGWAEGGWSQRGAGAVSLPPEFRHGT